MFGKPMLAADCDGDVSLLRYPLLASPKLDGVRAIITPDGVLSRSLKPIPNCHIQAALGSLPPGLDGELIVGSPKGPTVYRDTVSVVMSDDKPITGLRFYTFDLQGSPLPFNERLAAVHRMGGELTSPVMHAVVENAEQLLVYEADCLEEGYEGAMARDPQGRYKHGRATLREGLLTKVKRFHDAEAVIVGVKELMHNDNEAFTNELGRTARSTAQEGKRPGGMLGAITMLDPQSGLEFDCGTGFTLDERRTLWESRDRLPGQYGKYKFFPSGGKERPRHPVWLGLRNNIDLVVADRIRRSLTAGA